MNRSGLKIGRILSNYQVKKVENVVIPSLIQCKNYHFSVNKPELLKFSTTSISLESNRRSLFSTKETETTDAKKEEEAAEVSEAEKALQEQILTLEEKNADLLDKYRRSLADFENLRNRMNKQVSDAKIFGIQGFCKVTLFIHLSGFLLILQHFQDLLDVADVLNKAISSVPSSDLQQSQSLSDLHQGLQLTESQLLKVGLIISTNKDKFNDQLELL